MNEIKKRLKALEEEQAELVKSLSETKANLKFLCSCGKMHTIKKCVAIQTHWYTPPHGCTGGDYWNEGELQIICPDTDFKNRIHFRNHDIPWGHRHDYEYSAEEQFKRNYKPLFKEVIQDHDDDKRKWWNNDYFDQNHKKFDLNVKGRDYKTYTR
jgi:hypothetical protein